MGETDLSERASPGRTKAGRISFMHIFLIRSKLLNTKAK